jgi:hypothetical protein
VIQPVKFTTGKQRGSFALFIKVYQARARPVIYKDDILQIKDVS